MDLVPGSFEPIVCCWDWWDRPLLGLTVTDGGARHFAVEFDEELDDHGAAFAVWPAAASEVARDLRLWATWSAWRRGFDLGETSAAFEADEEYRELEAAAAPSRCAPADAVLAVPTWRFAEDRSFRHGTPRHSVAWTPL